MKPLFFITLLYLLVNGQDVIHRFDYLVTGAGSSGGPLSAKLGAKHPTALLEIGPNNDQLFDPQTVRNLDNNKWLGYNGQADVHYFTKPQQVTLYNGTVITRSWESRRYEGEAGCGNHNAGWGRFGVKEMYDKWPIGWKSKDMKPYLNEAFNKMRSSVPSKHAALQSKIMNEWKRATGYPIVPDNQLIDFSKLGIQKSIFNHIRHNDSYFERFTSYDAFVKPELKKPKTKLKVFNYRRVDRIIWELNGEMIDPEEDYCFEPDNEPIARALMVTNMITGKKELFYAEKEVILTGGSYQNVALLLRSGVGNCTELEAMNITCFVDNPLVGEGMLYHMVLASLMETNPQDAIIAANTQFTTQVGVAISTESKSFLDATIDFHMETNEVFLPSPPLPKPVVYAILLSMKDFGPGKVTIDPLDHYKVIIDLKLFQNSWEIPHMMAIFNQYRRLLNASSVYEKEFMPGMQVQSFEDKYNHVVQNIQFGEHPISTNAMLKVVNTKLQLYGAKRLRLASLDVIPNGNHVNPNMMAVAVGLKAADLVLRDVRKM
jgi:hypothetical protein